MKIIEFPFKENQVFKYKNKYYKTLTKTYSSKCNEQCNECDLENCNKFPLRCGQNKFFKESTDNLNYIELPFKINQVFKFNDEYYELSISDSNSCKDCSFSSIKSCLGEYIDCRYLKFIKINYYETLFKEIK